MRYAARMVVVRMAVGIMVRSSNHADQSVTLRVEAQPLGGVVVEEGGRGERGEVGCCCCCSSDGVGSGLPVSMVGHDGMP